MNELPVIQKTYDLIKWLLHPVKTQLFETKHGASFVGFRVLSDRIRVRTNNLRIGRKRMKRLLFRVSNGDLDTFKLQQSICSWDAHLQHGNTWRLRQRLFSSLEILKILEMG